jgi:hypothetical protein
LIVIRTDVEVTILNTDMDHYREPLTDDEASRMERGLRRLLNTLRTPYGKTLPLRR